MISGALPRRPIHPPLTGVTATLMTLALTMVLTKRAHLIQKQGGRVLPEKKNKGSFDFSACYSGPQKVDHSGHVHLLWLSPFQPRRIPPR